VQRIRTSYKLGCQSGAASSTIYGPANERGLVQGHAVGPSVSASLLDHHKAVQKGMDQGRQTRLFQKVAVWEKFAVHELSFSERALKMWDLTTQDEKIYDAYVESRRVIAVSRRQEWTSRRGGRNALDRSLERGCQRV
jgi:hypothetical protein